MYNYAESLLNQQKSVSKSSEVKEYIDSDIQVLKKECGLTVRSADIVQNAYAASPESNQNTSAIVHKASFAFPLPPEHPFKALWIKAREIVRNIADSLHMTKKQPDKAEQEEKTEKEETRYVRLYGVSAVKRNRYTDFISTDEALEEINLQTGLSLEQKAVQEQELKQEHLKPPEQIEMKKKSKQMEYGD